MSDIGSLIHADSNGKELREIYIIQSFDAVATLDGISDWELKIPVMVFEEQAIEIGHQIYLEGTEWGGIVNRIKTSADSIEVGGLSWRGLLRKNLITPPDGQAYREIKGKASSVIRELISDHFGSLFNIVADTEDITVSNKFRYQSIGEGIEETLQKHGARLEIVSTRDKVELRVKKIVDWSSQYELNEDYGAVLTIEYDESVLTNHIIALGRGELEERMVIEAWLLPDGTVTYDPRHSQRPRGFNEITYKLDYPNAESEEELKNKIIETFKERSRVNKAEIKLNDIRIINLNLGDIIATRDRLTGTYAKTSIAKKIYKISDNGLPSLRYEVAGAKGA